MIQNQVRLSVASATRPLVVCICNSLSIANTTTPTTTKRLATGSNFADGRRRAQQSNQRRMTRVLLVINAFASRTNHTVAQTNNKQTNQQPKRIETNQVLGRDVYQSNEQIGGTQIMYANGVSHLVRTRNHFARAIAVIVAARFSPGWFCFVAERFRRLLKSRGSQTHHRKKKTKTGRS
jgi:hypothetical protein